MRFEEVGGDWDRRWRGEIERGGLARGEVRGARRAVPSFWKWKSERKEWAEKIRFTYCRFGKVKILIIGIIFSRVVCIFWTAWSLLIRQSEFIGLDILIFCQCIFEKRTCRVSVDFVKNILESFQIISQVWKRQMAREKAKKIFILKQVFYNPWWVVVQMTC